MVRASARLPRRYSEIGDDVAVIAPRRGKLVLKVDMLVEHTDVPPGMTYRQAARKSVAMCVSDFAAKGVRPDSFLVSLGLKRGVTGREVEEIAEGFHEAEALWGVHLIGGDTNESGELVIDCAMVGFGSKVVTRTGASVGDVLVVTGPFGLAPSGLKVLTSGAEARKGFREKAVESVLRPSPNLKAGLALAPFLTSAMDSSDGLARSLHTLASQSRVGFELTKLPMADGVQTFAEANGLDPEKLVLEGGEEYAIVGTVGAKSVGEARRAAEDAGGTLIEIGKATPRGRGVVLKNGRRLRRIRDAGWTHLG